MHLKVKSYFQSSKHQHPSAREAPIFKLQTKGSIAPAWNLELGISLAVGAWCLELFIRVSFLQSLRLGHHLVFQIGAVFTVRYRADNVFKLRQRDEALPERRLFGTADLDARALFNRLHIRARLMQAGAGAGVQPREAARQPLHAQLAAPQILYVHRRDLQFAARRRLQVFRDADDLVVKDVKSRHGVIAFWVLRLFLNGNGLARRIKLHHAVAFRVVDVITVDRRAVLELRERAIKRIAAVKNVVAENQRHVVLANETLRDEKRLRDARRLGLLAILDGHAEAAAVAEQLLEARQIVRRGNEAQLANAALDERRERIINHRLVKHRLELLARDQRERIQPRAGAPRGGGGLSFLKK